MNFRRSRFCVLFLFLLQLFLLPLDPAALSGAEPELSFRSIRQARIEGRGWTETKAAFDRLPAKAEGVVREPVWRQSRDSAGLAVRFAASSRTRISTSHPMVRLAFSRRCNDVHGNHRARFPR